MYIVTVLAYIATIYLLFFKEELLASMIPLFIFFAFFHFAYLEIRHRGFLWIFTIVGVASILEILFLWFGTWQIPITILIFNTAIVLLAMQLKWQSGEKRKFKARWYFAVWWYVFTIFMTVAYSLFLIWGKGNFDLSCSNIEETSHSFLETVMTPFQLWKKQIQLIGDWAGEIKDTIKDSLDDFFTTDVGDVIGFTKKVEVEPVEDQTFWKKIAARFVQLKLNINNAVEEHLQVNLGICDLILNKIEKIYEHPAFQFTIVFLMFILLFPFVRITFWVVSLITLLVFKILYRLWVYKKYKIMEEVEEII